MTIDNPFRNSAMALWLNAVLTAIGPFFGSSTSYVVVALVLAILAMGLMRGKRMSAYIAFLIVGFLGGIVLGWIWSMSGPSAWWAIVTTVICWLTASMLLSRSGVQSMRLVPNHKKLALPATVS